MTRIAIVEDSKRDYENLNELLLRYSSEKGEIFDIKYFPNAVDFISDYSYDLDLIFLDIMMPGFSGMDAAKDLRKFDEGVTLIFVTNMPQFAIEGYNVNASFYLLKPLSYPELSDKMDKALAKIAKESSNDFLLLKPSFEKRKVFMKDIKYVEVFAHDVIFHLFQDDVHVRGTLSEYEKLLDPRRFCRVNSCYIVNLTYVTAVRDTSVFIGDTELKMSYARKKPLMEALAGFAGGGR